MPAPTFRVRLLPRFPVGIAAGTGISKTVTNGTVTIALADIATSRILANTSGVTAPPTANTGAAVTALLSNFTGDSGSGGVKGLVPAPAAGDAAAAKYLHANGSFQTIVPFAVRERLTGDRSYFVRTDGSDSNNGLADSAGGAFLTGQKAINTIANIDCAGFGVAVYFGAGTFTGAILVKSLPLNIGINGLQLIGAGVTTIISVTGSDAIAAYFGAHVRVDAMKIQTTTSGNGLASYFGALIDVGAGVEFGACAFSHMNAGISSVIIATLDYTISGDADSHWHAPEQGGAIILGAQTITLTGTPDFSAYFAGVNKGSITCGGVVFVGSATGKRFVVHYNGTLDMSLLKSYSFLPGDAPGQWENGAVIISSEYDRYDVQSVWKTYTPTATPSGGAGYAFVATGRYKQNGTIMTVIGTVTCTTIGTASGNLAVSLPVVAVAAAPACGWNISTGKVVGGYVNTGVALVGLQTDGAVFPFVSSGHILHFEITYEVAN